ncbi:SGNH/GDSL hydrolase family protein [Virgibacillus sp. C22-A2]|uniref:SGNH/GDSL hydrolase family protein n=1 Tax=Virgibacillus tibetensis TaxID=3042313 RepID=A0ABU6KJ29_9BACI|nr:SGNH/GDSL hydrolase family protein [Virgibacillus sp. C22-A2]
MKKVSLIITGIALLLIVTGIFVLMNKPASTFDNVTIPEEDEIDEETPEEQPQEDEEDQEQAEDNENEESDPRQFTTVIAEAVQSTIDFFSTRETHVVAIGDSLTQGVGGNQEQGGYVGILDRTINENEQLVTFDNFGVRGNRSGQLLDRLDNPEIESAVADSDIVLITIGANDIMQVVKENFANINLGDFVEERARYEERLEQILTKIRNINPNTEIYLVGFYNPFEQYFGDIEELGIIVEDWNRTGRTMAGNRDNVTFIPTADLFEGSDEVLFAEDNFHPNDLGYKRIARRVLEYLTN